MSQENMIRLTIFLLMAISFTISGYFRRKADQSDEKTNFEEENPTLLRMRNIGALVMYGSILLYFIHPPLMAWGQIKSLPVGIRWGAVGVLALLVPVFYWMFSSLGKNITPTVTIRSEHQLVTSGPYRWIRHPLYTFGFIMIVAVCVAMANWFSLMVALITWIPVAMRIPLEEQKLIEEFGDLYREYMRVTGRYLPKICR
jgi:protein-S-isoprenylcysteine O-methyltransferase Ste14